MKRRAYRQLLEAQSILVILASLLAAYLGTQSQRGGIAPWAAALCPPFGAWSILFGPNDKWFSEWHAVHWGIALSSTALLGASNWAAYRASRPATINIAVFVCILSVIWWLLLGLARVGYSMG